MGSFTEFLSLEVLDHVFGDTAYTAPATLHIGLSTTTITDSGTNDTEPVGNAYARSAVTNNVTNWPVATGDVAGVGEKSNGTTITFPEATGAWGTVIDFAIYDDPTAGNMLGYGTLGTPKPVTDGDTREFLSGELDITLD
jgi:hypothetical protein